MCLPAASPASLLAMQASNLEPVTRAICGPQQSSASASYDPVSRCWKTFQASFLPDTLEEFSATWPKAGMTQGGVFYPQPKWERRIKETGSGLWLTPAVGMVRGEHYTPETSFRPMTEGRQIHLSQQVRDTRMFPTPMVPNGGRQHKLDNLTLKGNTLYRTDGSKAQMDLETYVRLWPTPRVSDANGHQIQPGKQGGPGLNRLLGGKLNPRWVEWLMDMPEGWTSLKPLEMHRWQVWLGQHGIY